MIFSSIPFLFAFFPIFLIVYYFVPFKYKNYILLAFSLIFYAWGEPIYILLMIFSSVVDYFNGKLIEKYDNDQKKRKLFLILSIVINISLLGIFKYSDFLIGTFNGIFSTSIPLPNLPLPIGISFFTFQTMSYSIDVYFRNVKAEKSFLNFMTYVSMFPQLIAGPIVRYETVSNELSKRTININKFSEGLIRFLKGLFKKVLIANNIGLLWQTISSSNFNEISIVTAWLGIIAFAFQIYFDFSGYSDMAIGMGKMLGFTYLENFDYPYISKSITEFWRRWHISLSTWFKDYVYIPLGGSRVSRIINIRNILIVWMLTGIWHGAAINFIIWGLYFGIILIIEKFFLKKYLDKLPNVFKHLYAIFFILIGWLIFAFDDFTNLQNYGKILFGLGNRPFISSEAIYYIINYFVIIVAAVVFSIPTTKYIGAKPNKFKNKNLIFIVGTILFIIMFIVTISFLVSDSYNPFLYFRF